MSELTPEAVKSAMSRFKVGRRAPDIPKEVNDDLEIIFKGARKYANPDMEAFHKALYEWFHSERPMSSDVEKALVAAALGVTEDDNIHLPRVAMTEAQRDVTEDE